MISIPTREAGLARLNAFIAHAGRDYAANRNIDHGPLDRSNVSVLSPYIRRRLITEEEVIAAILKRHSFSAAEKFIQEVVWRSYWKGWLEMRPSVLARYNEELRSGYDALAKDSALNRRFLSAIEGRTGIACFDAWAGELIQYGWIHNHARMWFASIWIFTLGLPWQLGADFFYRHLLDADPASNTLSWRWVAGLHTAGKHYLARAENIDLNTTGRFKPYGKLNERADGLTETEGHTQPMALPDPERAKEPRVALLLTEEDLHAESLGITAKIAGIAALPSLCAADEVSPAMRFARGAIADGCVRASANFGVPAGMLSVERIAAWAQDLDVKEVVTAYAPVGPVQRQLIELRKTLAQDGIRLTQLRRDWDNKSWPHATAGFFKLKTKIPSLIAHLA